MSDERLRGHRRSWSATGSVVDEARYLRERMRVGHLTAQDIELAAYCGSEAARALLNREPISPPTDWLRFGHELEVKFGRQACLVAAVAGGTSATELLDGDVRAMLQRALAHCSSAAATVATATSDLGLREAMKSMRDRELRSGRVDRLEALAMVQKIVDLPTWPVSQPDTVGRGLGWATAAILMAASSLSGVSISDICQELVLWCLTEERDRKTQIKPTAE